MKKVFATLILGAASTALFAASFLTTDAASYMDWAKESGPAIHQEMKAMKSTLPFHEEKDHDHHKVKKVKRDVHKDMQTKDIDFHADSESHQP